MSIRFMLIDHDHASRHSIRLYLAGRPDFEMIGEADTSDEAVTTTRLLRPDVIFADAGLLQETRFFVPSVFSEDQGPVMVFLSADQNFALQAFDVGGADFLLKPVRQDRFEVCLARIRNQIDSRRARTKSISGNTPRDEMPSVSCGNQERIAVTSRRRTLVIETSKIDWIGAAGDYSELHVAGATHLLREPLSVLLNRLPSDMFFRIHRSFVVNLNKVSGFKALRNQDFLVKMKDRTILRASRTFSEDFRTAIARQERREVATAGSSPVPSNSGAVSAIYA
ncbi:MAG TPA: LytTR family DNA-binding domain-containing protein [Bryobacteraceae bacterium]